MCSFSASPLKKNKNLTVWLRFFVLSLKNSGLFSKVLNATQKNTKPTKNKNTEIFLFGCRFLLAIVHFCCTLPLVVHVSFCVRKKDQVRMRQTGLDVC
jgi:hypothetical protein